MHKPTHHVALGVCSISLLFLLCMTSVSASKPNIDIRFDMRPSIGMGNVSVGKIFFIEGQPISETTNRSMLGNFSMMQYDRMVWRNTSSIEMTSPGGVVSYLAMGDPYVFTQVGAYTYRPLTDNGSFRVSVITAPQTRINITSSSDLSLSHPSGIQMTSRDMSMDVRAEVLPTTSIGNHTYSFTFTYPKMNRTFTRGVVVSESRNWSVTDIFSNTSIGVKSDSIINIGSIRVKNDGNKDIPLVVAVSGNGSDFIQVIGNPVIPKQSSNVFTVIAQIPKQQKDGNYGVEIRISNDAQVYVKSFSLRVMDIIKPEIRNITISEQVAYRKSEFKVIAFDNVAVNHVSMRYSYGNSTDKTVNMTKDQQTFTHAFTFNTTDTYAFSFCAVDSSGNTACQNISRSWDKNPLVQTFGSLKIPGRKFGDFAKMHVFTLNISMPVSVNLTDFTTDMPNVSLSDVTVRISRDGGDNYRFTSIGQAVNISQSGRYFFEIRSPEILEYEARLSFSMPKHTVVPEAIRLSGRFLNYTVPDAFSTMVGDINYSCETLDTGDYESSGIYCTAIYPISTPIEDMSVIMTVDQKDMMKRSMDDKVSMYKRKAGIYALGISIALAVAVVIFTLLYFMVYVYPNFRFKWGDER